MYCYLEEPLMLLLCFAPRETISLWELLVGKCYHPFLSRGYCFYEYYYKCNMWLFNFHACTFLFIQFLFESSYLILHCFYLWLYLRLSIVRECSAPLAKFFSVLIGHSRSFWHPHLCEESMGPTILSYLRSYKLVVYYLLLQCGRFFMTRS